MSLMTRVGVASALVVVGATAGVSIDRTVLLANSEPLARSDVNEQGVHYQFINPLLFCQDQNISSLTNSRGNQIQSEISAYIQSQKNVGAITNAAVYFRDLGDGPWALINPSFRSVPASLLKVPTAIGVYKRAEKDPTFLTKKSRFTSTKDSNATQYFQPTDRIASGKVYTIEELLRYMLQDSDNNALIMVGNAMDVNDLVDAYNDLGVDPPSATSSGYTIGVRTFASFFRVLYNASYLSQSDSEHMLSLLAQSSFPQGLEAGVPQNITVAHKFGEYDSGNGQKELNDCGIVYKPHDPYILCVMTEGDDFSKLAGTIKGVSQNVWDILQNTQN